MGDTPGPNCSSQSKGSHVWICQKKPKVSPAVVGKENRKEILHLLFPSIPLGPCLQKWTGNQLCRSLGIIVCVVMAPASQRHSGYSSFDRFCITNNFSTFIYLFGYCCYFSFDEFSILMSTPEKFSVLMETKPLIFSFMLRCYVSSLRNSLAQHHENNLLFSQSFV